MIKKIPYTVKHYIALILYSFLVMVLCTKSSPIYVLNDWYDANAYYTMGRELVNGSVLYNDLFDHKGPLIYLINVLGLLISEYRGIYVIELITIFITFVFIYKIARLKCDEKISLLILFLTSSALFKYFELGNLTEEYALPFITISIYFFADYFFNKK